MSLWLSSIAVPGINFTEESGALFLFNWIIASVTLLVGSSASSKVLSALKPYVAALIVIPLVLSAFKVIFVPAVNLISSDIS